MHPASPGERAARLSWLCPGAAGIAALARPDHAASWPDVRRDPGCVALALRRWDDGPAHPDTLREVAAALRRDPEGRLDAADPAVHAVLSRALCVARTAEALATKLPGADPERAWAAGLFAHLGWLAVAATNAESLSRCLSDPTFRTDPVATQIRHWGLDAGGVARRLGWRWRLPAWLNDVVGRLHLPLSTAQHFGADGALFGVVQLACAISDAATGGLAIAPGTDPAELLHRLGLGRDALPRFERPPEVPALEDPYAQPLLLELLATRTDGGAFAPDEVARLEREIDLLHIALASQRSAEDERLRRAKLEAVAEFAAGAGHEINNPLAVISGHGQYLLAREDDPAKQSALQAMIRQTQRIYSILTDLMHFARPAAPRKEPLDIRATVAGVLRDMADLAEKKRIRMDYSDTDGPLALLADGGQVHLALTCLVRNAIEAAPEDGWVGVSLERPADGTLGVVVEDSGPGVPAEHREHLFDPFYSGRSAGRGRGLGLPTAWRLAREHGGDVRFVPSANGPTRFVLTLPTAPADEHREAA